MEVGSRKRKSSLDGGSGKRKLRKQDCGEKDDCYDMQEKIVYLLRDKVRRIGDELEYLRSHEAFLKRAWSTPIYPPDYSPGSWTAPKGPGEQVYPRNEQRETGNGQGLQNRDVEQGGNAKERKVKTSRQREIPAPLPPPQSKRKSDQEIEESDKNTSSESGETSSESDDEERSPSPLIETTTVEPATLSESSDSEVSSSDDEGEERKPWNNKQDSSSESDDDKPQATFTRGASKDLSKFSKVNWTNDLTQKRASMAGASSDSDSNDSDESVSMVEVANEEVVQEKPTHTTEKGHSTKKSVATSKIKKTFPKKSSSAPDDVGEVKPQKTAKPSPRSAKPSEEVKKSTSVRFGSTKAAQLEKLSADATAEDTFDWKVLGLPGPWTKASSSSSSVEVSQWPKQLTSFPCSFSSFDEYIARYQCLVLEECKAHIDNSWEILQKMDTPSKGSLQCSLDLSSASSAADGYEDRLETRTCQICPMHKCADDAFNYSEVEAMDGRRIQLDTSEVLLVSFPKRPELKVLALVNNPGGSSVLLKTRVDLKAGQCKLARMSNLVTLKRQFVSLLGIPKLWPPIRQQLLEPLVNVSCMMSPPTDDCLDENVRLPSDISSILSTWKEHAIFNNRQLLTMAALLQMKQGILLVQGMLSALCIEEPGAKILVCAASNAAVDEIVSRLMFTMLDKNGKLYAPKLGTLVRVGVPKSVQPSCHPVTMDTLLSRCSKSSRPTARLDMLSSASIICSTLSGSGHPIFDEINQKFDVLIIDEAAQALECETLIALQRAKSRCVIVGDPCQLPATVIQRPGTAYGRSLFERMQEGGLKAFLMTTQYRMNPQISMYPSAKFYRGCLRDSKSTQSMQPLFKKEACDSGISCDGYRFRLGPYCFLDVSWGEEELELTGYSLSNIEEAAVVATVADGVVRSLAGNRRADIGVITPYLAQRSTILTSLQKYGLDDTVIEVNTVDGFQGREKDVIILSCVRAATEKGLGFVSDEKRMNVALTRAKHALIIVGHGKTLQSQSPAWASLLEDARLRGCYQVLRSGGADPTVYKPLAGEEILISLGEKAASFHSAQQKSPSKLQSFATPRHPQPPLQSPPSWVPATVKEEPVTCDFAHHLSGCGHLLDSGVVPETVHNTSVKRMRGAVRVNGPAQPRGGGNSKRGRGNAPRGSCIQGMAAPPNHHIYFGQQLSGDNQQELLARPLGYEVGRTFHDAHKDFRSPAGGEEGGTHGGRWNNIARNVNQIPAFNSPNVHPGRKSYQNTRAHHR